MQHAVELRQLLGAQGKALLQRRGFQQGLQGGGGEPFPGQPEQEEQAATDARLALLAAVGEAPGQVHPGGIPITEH